MGQGMNRRNFLQATAAAAVGPSIMNCATVGAYEGKRTPPSERITMGAIGLGWQGPGNLEQFLRMKDVQVLALCDVDQNHLDRMKGTVDRTYDNNDCATYKNFEELLARTDIDTLMIALPDHWHAIPAIQAANAGLDIYGEKPISHRLREGRAMADAVTRNNRIWQTGSWQRSKANFHRACELVRNGRIGKVTHVEVGLHSGYSDYAKTEGQSAFSLPPAELDYDRWLGPAPFAPYCPMRIHKNWRWVLDYGGGRIMDWIGHHLDIAHWGLGFDHTGPVSVEGTGTIPEVGVWDTPAEYDCTCTYADGTTIRISDKCAAGAKWFGEDGWLFAARGDTLEAEHPAVLKEVIGDDEIRLYKSTDHFRNFIDCVKSREETITPAEVSHRSASVGHLCNIAIFTGRKIHWDPDKEEIVGDDPVAKKMLEPNYRAPWTLDA
jgi:predicted dehydrogenase